MPPPKFAYLYAYFQCTIRNMHIACTVGCVQSLYPSSCPSDHGSCWVFIYMTKHPVPDQESSAKPCGVLLPQWGTPSPAPQTSSKEEGKRKPQRERLKKSTFPRGGLPPFLASTPLPLAFHWWRDNERDGVTSPEVEVSCRVHVRTPPHKPQYLNNQRVYEHQT